MRMKPVIRIAHKAGRGTYGPRRSSCQAHVTSALTGRSTRVIFALLRSLYAG